MGYIFGVTLIRKMGRTDGNEKGVNIRGKKRPVLFEDALTIEVN